MNLLPEHDGFFFLQKRDTYLGTGQKQKKIIEIHTRSRKWGELAGEKYIIRRGKRNVRCSTYEDWFLDGLVAAASAPFKDFGF